VIFLLFILIRFAKSLRSAPVLKTFGLEVGIFLSRMVDYKLLKMGPSIPMKWPRKMLVSSSELRRKLKMVGCSHKDVAQYFSQNRRKSLLGNGLDKIIW
jgi:hypothetical protein